MAFRERDPNAVGPFVSNDDTWRSQKRKAVASAAVSNENIVAPRRADTLRDETSVTKSMSSLKLASSANRNKTVVNQQQGKLSAGLPFKAYQHDSSTASNKENPMQIVGFAPSLFSQGAVKRPALHGKAINNLSRAVGREDSPAFPHPPSTLRTSSGTGEFDLETLVPKKSSSVASPIRSFQELIDPALQGPDAEKHISYSLVARSNLPALGKNGRADGRGFIIYNDSIGEKEKQPVAPPKRSFDEYVRMIRNLSASKDVGAATKAEMVLRRMITESKTNSDLRPDGACYNSYV